MVIPIPAHAPISINDVGISVGDDVGFGVISTGFGVVVSWGVWVGLGAGLAFPFPLPVPLLDPLLLLPPLLPLLLLPLFG
jgi:hypothetical protein